MKNKILFIKTIIQERTITELNAQAVLNDEKYNNNPYINKHSIVKAYEEYEEYLNPLNSDTFTSLFSTGVNVEGHFLSTNIPEIESIVYDKTCRKDDLYELLDSNDDLTHIALSSYAIGLENSIELINIIKNEFPHLELFVGGFGAVYPQIKELINPKNLCIGDGVNFLRNKFNLSFLKSKDFKIPHIEGNATSIPLPFNVTYMITQLGCPLNCDFCITHDFFHYQPLLDVEKIITYFKELSLESHRDLIIFLSEANAFYPEQRWKQIFDYFIANPHEIDKNIFLLAPSSLTHFNKFNIERIQEKSPLKFLAMNYGIESTLTEGYIKNKGNVKKIIDRLNRNGIITWHTSILGLAIHTKNNILVDVKNHCDYHPDMISFNTFKPVPGTLLYNELHKENRLLFDKLPPEFFYMEGYLPFVHPNLGYGFDILPHAFSAYYESEKELMSVYLNLADKMADLLALTNNRRMRTSAKLLLLLGKQNFPNFKSRMPPEISNKYQTRLNNIISKTSHDFRKMTFLVR